MFFWNSLAFSMIPAAAAAAAKSLQSCPTLWDPVDGSPPGSPVPGILKARTLEWALLCCPLLPSSIFHSIRVFIAVCRLSLVVARRSYSPFVVCRLLIAAASLIAEHR